MKSRIKEATGERIGQLVYNAIRSTLGIEGDDTVVASKLFYMEDDELIMLVQDYINKAKINNGKM